MASESWAHAELQLNRFLLSIICTLNFYISKKGAIFAKIWHKPLD